MIIHNSQRGPTMVRVINLRLPTYRAFYGDGFGDVVQGLFARLVPRVIPVAKQLGMKAIDVVRDKDIAAVGDVASKAFSAIKERLARLIRRKPQPVKLPSTTDMPANVSKRTNKAANQNLAELASVPTSENEKNITASLVAGSGLRVRRRR